MIKCSHATLIYISGLVWLIVGLFLLRTGFGLLLGESMEASTFTVVILSAFLVGYLKGRFVLKKTVHRGVERILSFPNPTHLGNLYSPKYYLLLGGMVVLGMSIKFLGVPPLARGIVDVAIGIALLTGALVYFKQGGLQRQSAKE